MHTHKRTHWLTVIPAGTSPSGPGGQQTGKQHCWYFSCTGTYGAGGRSHRSASHAFVLAT